MFDGHIICGRSESAGFVMLLFSPQIQIDRRSKAGKKKLTQFAANPTWRSGGSFVEDIRPG
jgi:hypothetical protein